jgi:hypothetical protein
MVMVGVGLAAADLLFYALVYWPAPAYAHDPYTLLGDGVGQHVGEVYADNPAVRVYYLLEPGMRLNGTSLIEYFAPGVDDQQVEKILPHDFEPGDEALFILSAPRADELAALLEAYPGGSVWRLRDREGRLVFVSYRVRFDDDAPKYSIGPARRQKCRCKFATIVRIREKGTYGQGHVVLIDRC